MRPLLWRRRRSPARRTTYSAAKRLSSEVTGVAIRCRARALRRLTALRRSTPISFLHLQTKLDQPADGFGNGLLTGRLCLELDTALFLDRGLLNSNHLTLHLCYLGRCLLVATHKECRRPEDDYRRCGRHAIAGAFAVLDPGKGCRSRGDGLGLLSKLLAAVLLVHYRRDIRRSDIRRSRGTSTQRSAQRQDSQNTHLLIPRPGSIQAQPEVEGNRQTRQSAPNGDGFLIGRRLRFLRPR